RIHDQGAHQVRSAHRRVASLWHQYGAAMKLHMIVHGSDGALKAHHVVPSPRLIYIHDFFATRNQGMRSTPMKRTAISSPISSAMMRPTISRRTTPCSTG